MNELRVDIGGSNRGFQIATDQTKKIAQDLQRSLDGFTPDTFKGAQAMRDKYGKAFDAIKGSEGIGGLAEKFLRGFGESGEAVLQLATGPVGVLSGALFAVGEVAKKSWETMRESFMLAREARTLGFSTVGLQRLNQASAEQGYDEGEGANRLYKLQNKVGDAAAGDKAAKGFFKDMGVEVDGKNMEQILNEIAEAFDKIQDPAERGRKAVELFGRGGQEMIPILREMKEGGGFMGGIVSDEQTDSVLGGTWKKIHGFFTKVKDAGKATFKDALADVITGATGYQGDDVQSPDKVKVQESPEEKAAKAKEAIQHAKELTAAQKEYHQALESTSNESTKLALMLGDERDLKQALAKAEAAHDEVEALKIKTELLSKQKQIGETTKALQDSANKQNKTSVGERSHASQHVDSLSSAGFFSSAGALSSPMIDIGNRQLKKLEDIHSAITNRPDIFA